MRIVLDTGMLFRPEAIWALTKERAPIVLPAVAFAERCRQLVRDGRDVGAFLAEIRRFEIEIEAFGAREALVATERRLADPTWTRLARDAMIAGHVREDDVLWTTNPRDFLELGLRPDQVRGV